MWGTLDWSRKKCDRFITALTFLLLTMTKSTQSACVSEIQTLKQRITTWKQSYYKKKALKRAMKESSPDVLHPTAVTAITSHTPMWEDFQRIVKDARKKRIVSQDDLTLCTAATRKGGSYGLPRVSGTGEPLHGVLRGISPQHSTR